MKNGTKRSFDDLMSLLTTQENALKAGEKPGAKADPKAATKPATSVEESDAKEPEVFDDTAFGFPPAPESPPPKVAEPEAAPKAVEPKVETPTPKPVTAEPVKATTVVTPPVATKEPYVKPVVEQPKVETQPVVSKAVVSPPCNACTRSTGPTTVLQPSENDVIIRGVSTLLGRFLDRDAHQGFAEVRQVFTNDGEITEEHKAEIIKVHQLTTPHSTVSLSAGAKMSFDTYGRNHVKVDAFISVPCHIGEEDNAMTFCRKFVERHVEDTLKNAQPKKG